MTKQITIQMQDGSSVTKHAGTIVGSLIPSRLSAEGLPYIAALVNNDVASLSYPLGTNCDVRFLTMSDQLGWRVYRRSLCFLLSRTIRELFPQAKFAIEHSFGLGLYCSFAQSKADPTGITREQLERIDAHMREAVEKDLPIRRVKICYTEAVTQFEQSGQYHKLNLLKYRNPPHVVLYSCEPYTDLAHGPLAPSAGVLDRFELLHYKPGFVLHLPDRSDPLTLPPFEDQPHLFNIFKEHKEWGRVLGVNTVGRLNEVIARGQIDDFIRTAEALHEKKIARIADEIASARDRIRVALIAGPSSSGKTTFAKRLTVHLMVNGLKPVVLGTDDYFVGKDKNPIDEDGKPDYEHIDAVDIEQFNRDLLDLIEGREIEVPRFNFNTKEREYRGEMMRLESDQILIVEGIHGLNPKLTHMVPADRKFRIYASALTQLSVDLDNRISTTDNRLMRRMLRDFRTRGHSPLNTLTMWPSVRRGEKRWIFPFQKEANATFNSALDYELAVLKPMVEPLLMQVKPSSPEYAESRRLSEFLLNFIPAPSDAVPQTSVLREFIGGSGFKY